MGTEKDPIHESSILPDPEKVEHAPRSADVLALHAALIMKDEAKIKDMKLKIAEQIMGEGSTNMGFGKPAIKASDIEVKDTPAGIHIVINSDGMERPFEAILPYKPL